jgi:hypothetical protein
MEEFKEVLLKNKPLFDTIEQIVKQTGERPEGNCMWQDMTTIQREELLPKQYNLWYLGKSASDILEIGFNAGHSCLLFLLANPTSKIVLFDIGIHKYTRPCFEYLSSLFPDRLTLYIGNSHQTVPEFIRNNPTTKFDVMHIDGYHEVNHVRKEIYNVRDSAKATNIVVLDDDDYPALNTLHREFLKNGVIRLVDDKNIQPTTLYAHLICSYIF